MGQEAQDDPAGNDAMQAVGFDRDQIADGAVALESVLDPVDTIFVEHLRQAGASVARGLDMWLAQAAGQEQRWAASGW
jgi:shikimate 5-dehydrogenase